MSTTALHATIGKQGPDSASRLAVFGGGTNCGSLGAACRPLRPGPRSLLDWRHEIHRLRGRGDFWFCFQQSADELGLFGVQRSKLLSLAGGYGDRRRPAYRQSAVLGSRRLGRQRVGRRHVLDHVELPPHDARACGRHRLADSRRCPWSPDSSSPKTLCCSAHPCGCSATIGGP